MKRSCKALPAGKWFTKNLLDTILISMAVLYVVSPVMIFLLGWTKKGIAVLGCILCMYFMVRLIKALCTDKSGVDQLLDKGRAGFWLISIFVIFLWVLFSGIGGFSFQTADFLSRNPMFHDLLKYPWPVYYDLSKEPSFVQELIGNAQSASYVYYFAWWLPAALLSKLFWCRQAVSDMMLFLWAVLGVFLTFYCLVRYLKKNSYWILSMLVLFGGMDCIVYVLTHMEMPSAVHLEQWAGYFQYSSNTTQLYWVFNQSVPVWLIMALLLLLNDRKKKAGLCALAFAYSPFSTMGLVPIALAGCLKKSRKVKEAVAGFLSVENIAVPVMMLVIFGAFYMQNDHSLSKTGWIFSFYPGFRTVTMYIVFLVSEVLVYFIPMGAHGRKYRYYWVALAELVLIPFYVMGLYNDFCMRSSIPALFLLMVLLLQYLLDNEVKKLYPVRRKIMTAAVLAGYLTAVIEIQRSVSNTLLNQEHEYIADSVGSFGNMQMDSEYHIRLILNQYLPTDYKDSFFYKYIAER